MGTLTQLFQSALVWLHPVVGNWGLAIMLFTFILRITLFPLQALTSVQQGRLEKIKPALDAMMAKWKADPAKYLQESRRLKKNSGISDGLLFLSILIQLPIFLAMYKMISASPYLTGASFGWLASLAAPDPRYVLPLVVAIFSGFQIRHTKRSMKFLPALNFAFMLALPSGVVLYYATSGFLQLVGDIAIKKWLIPS